MSQPHQSLAARHLETESFYHLAGAPIDKKPCRGLACFVARHLDAARWARAACDEPPLYCCGKCFASPSCMADRVEPEVRSMSREPVLLGCPAPDGTALNRGDYCALPLAIRQTPEQIVSLIEASELRGRGGASVSTGLKWRAALQESSKTKFIIANADEGDPGSFSDKILIERYPHALLEGMTIAGYATGARQGFIYLRCEYPEAFAALSKAISKTREAGIWDSRVNGAGGASFDVNVVVGSGSYMCGEETALINSIEGRRPEAMIRPPYPTQRGLFGKPTVVNNVETLCNIPWIIRHGAQAFRSLGFSRSRGTKLISLNSLFQRPGVYEVEFGISVREIVERLGGGLRTGEVKGVIIGGPLAGIVPPHLFDTPFGFEELRAFGASVGHGGVVAFDERTTIPQLVHHIFQFGASESCGKCTPCRLGTRRIEQIFGKIVADGHASVRDKDQWTQIVSALRQTSLCGMGSGLAEFADSVLKYYSRELDPCYR